MRRIQARSRKFLSKVKQVYKLLSPANSLFLFKPNTNMSKGTKRKASPATRTEQENPNAAKRTRRYKPQSEPDQFFQDHRELVTLSIRMDIYYVIV